MALNAATVSGPTKWVSAFALSGNEGSREKAAGLPERPDAKDVSEFVSDCRNERSLGLQPVDVVFVQLDEPQDDLLRNRVGRCKRDLA